MERIKEFKNFILEAKTEFNKDVLDASNKEEIKNIYPSMKITQLKSSHIFGTLEKDLFFKAYYKKAYKEYFGKDIKGEFKITAIYYKKGMKIVDLYRENEPNEIDEDFVPAGFGNTNPTSTPALGRSKQTGYDMKAIAGPIMELSKCIKEQGETYDKNDNPDHTLQSYVNEAKGHVCSKIDESCSLHESEEITEADDYEFEPGAAVQRLKARQEMNVKRYRAAQKRGDNYAIKMYELRIKMDKVDAERIKIQNAIHELEKRKK